MNAKPTYSSGHGESHPIILPPTETDCQQWETDIPAEQWSTGVAKNLLRVEPVEETDCSNCEMAMDVAASNQKLQPAARRPHRWLLFAGIAACITVMVGIGYVTFNRVTPVDPLDHVLFKNFSASDRQMLKSADESTIVGITLSCDNSEIRKLGEQYRNDPKTLLKIIRKELEK